MFGDDLEDVPKKSNICYEEHNVLLVRYILHSWSGYNTLATVNHLLEIIQTNDPEFVDAIRPDILREIRKALITIKKGYE